MKPQNLILSLYFLIFLTFTATGQQPEPTPPANDKDDSIKISTTLIQIDATVTDKDGNIVKDLKPEDFEVYENGKKQEISNLSFISVDPQTNKLDVTASRKNSKNQPAIPVPPIKLKQEEVRRTYAIVVDDLGISFDNVTWVQHNLKKFVNEQMQDGDLVAIIRTGAGNGALQSFTSDRRQLLAAIDKIRWNPQGRGGISTFSPIGMDLKDQLQGIGKSNVQGGKEDKEFLQQVEDFRRNNFSVGTLGALNYVIRGMRELPGRKSLLLISEGFVFRNPDGSRNQVFDAMQVLADQANRSSVVIYTLDPRGLQIPGMFSAEDNVTDVFPDSPGSAAREDREAKFNQSLQSLRYLSYQTGGFPFDNQNGLGKGILKAVNDQNSYYLIGYHPDEETFDPKKNKFNKLEVKVLRPGLKIRYRSGFFNIAEEKIQQAAQKTQTPQQKLISALISPFGASDINLDLYSIFYNDEKNRNFIRSLVVIDANDLTFTLADGLYHAKFEAVAAVFDINGARADNGIGTHNLKFTPEQMSKIREKGIVYDLPVPIVKSGAYQFRIAVRDIVTGKIGAVSQYIEVPNLKKNKVTLSNFVLDNFTPEEWKKFTRGEFSGNPLVNSTARRYKRGTVLRYSYAIYNAQPDRARKPQLEIQMRLLRDGKVILDDVPVPFDAKGQTDLARIEASDALILGNDLTPGTYILQVIVYDKTAAENNRFGTQFVEFDIIK
jgi:VWFA-related protein